MAVRILTRRATTVPPTIVHSTLAAREGASARLGASVRPPLGTIADLSATAGVESAVLSWTAAANATSQQPQYSDDGSTWTNFGSALSGSATQVTVTGLTASVSYSFRVVASDGVTTTTSNVDTAAPTEASADHPNEPAGLTMITDRAFNARVEDSWTATDGSMATFDIVTDATAPRSPSNVGRITFPAGLSGNGSSSQMASTTLGGLSGYTDQIYIHFWLMLSANWYAHDFSAVNKVFYVGDPLIIDAHGSGTGDMHLMLAIQGGENVNCTYNSVLNEVSPTAAQAEIVRGQWHEIEVLVELNTPTVANGTLHAWIDGVKTHQFGGRRILGNAPYNVVNRLDWHPIYGGGGASNVPADQWMYMDHVYLSAA